MEAEVCFAFLLYQNEPGSHVCTVQVLWHTQITKMHFAVFYANAQKSLRNQFFFERKIQICQVCVYCLWVQVRSSL